MFDGQVHIAFSAIDVWGMCFALDIWARKNWSLHGWQPASSSLDFVSELTSLFIPAWGWVSCAFLEGLKKHWGLHWFNLSRLTKKWKEAFIVLSVFLCKEFCKSQTGSVLIEKNLKNHSPLRMNEEQVWYNQGEHIVYAPSIDSFSFSCLAGEKGRARETVWLGAPPP